MTARWQLPALTLSMQDRPAVPLPDGVLLFGDDWSFQEWSPMTGAVVQTSEPDVVRQSPLSRFRRTRAATFLVALFRQTLADPIRGRSAARSGLAAGADRDRRRRATRCSCWPGWW